MEPAPNLEELRDAPLLRGIERHDPFVVPAGFFDRFPAEIQRHVHARSRIGIVARMADRPVPWRPRIALGALMAAALLGWVWSAWPTHRHTADVRAEVGPDDLMDAGIGEDLVYDVVQMEEGLLDGIILPDDDAEIVAYLENQDLPLDLLME